MTPRELIYVAVKVLWTHFVIDTIEPQLERCPEVFQTVGGSRPRRSNFPPDSRRAGSSRHGRRGRIGERFGAPDQTGPFEMGEMEGERAVGHPGPPGNLPGRHACVAAPDGQPE